MAKPLTELIKRDAKFHWEQRHQKAFENLKAELCSEHVLPYPDFDKPFILTTDASKVAVAAILSQEYKGVERPIAYASRQMNKAEQNYSASEAEMLALIWVTKHFRCYLYGRKFIVRTDHSALRFLHQFSDNNARLMRWSLRLAEFDFTVEHKPGKKIPHVDALSRQVQAVTAKDPLTKDRVVEEQKADEFCKSLRPGKVNSRSEYFYDADGAIYRRQSEGEHQLVIPKGLAREVINTNHDPIYAAHPGRKRTFEVVRLRHWWPGMRRDIDRYVQECDECNRRKQGKEFRAPLGEVMEPTDPFEITSMDICGPYPLTPRKNKYLLTFICHLTKYVEAVPIPDMSAETCARAYATQVTARHGSGSILVTDQGRSFTSVFFKEICRILGIAKMQTSSYHPSSNGTIERFHKTMNQGMSHYVNSKGSNWDTLVPFYLMAYRATPHGTGQYSPFFLLHGREMVLPTLQGLRAKVTPELRNTEQESRLENLKSSLQKAYKLVRKNKRTSHQVNRRYYDRKAQERKILVGDIVYLFNPAKKPGQCQKFRKPWIGPFKVAAKLSELNYRIVNLFGKESVVHVNRLKKAHNSSIWKPKPCQKQNRRPKKKKKETDEDEEEAQEEDGVVGIRHGIVTEPSQVGDQTQDSRRPRPGSPSGMDTPAAGPQCLDAPGSQRADPNYVPPDTPRSRRELRTHRADLPHTRLRARMRL
jgi:transposase InsO family protein